MSRPFCCAQFPRCLRCLLLLPASDIGRRRRGEGADACGLREMGAAHRSRAQAHGRGLRTRRQGAHHRSLRTRPGASRSGRDDSTAGSSAHRKHRRSSGPAGHRSRRHAAAPCRSAGRGRWEPPKRASIRMPCSPTTSRSTRSVVTASSAEKRWRPVPLPSTCASRGAKLIAFHALVVVHGDTLGAAAAGLGQAEHAQHRAESARSRPPTSSDTCVPSIG